MISANTSILEVNSVSKRYCKGIRRSMTYAAFDIASEFSLSGGCDHQSKLRTGEFWAIRNISFNLKKGESLGIIGHNGAGKTTLLKMIAGILKPDQGQIKAKGNVSALFVQGPGFHPLLSGRENMFIAGSILGYSRRAIRANEERIVTFAEIGDAIDTPVFTYSSGMLARLGFAIAAHLEPDLLLIDEVLAVGDAAFQSRCLERVHQLRASGTAFIVVSHNPYQISRFCDRALVLQQGAVLREVQASEAVAEHFRLANNRNEPNTRTEPDEEAKENRALVHHIEILSGDGMHTVGEIESGEHVRFRLHYRIFLSVDDLVLSIIIENEQGILVAQDSSRRLQADSTPGHERCIDVSIPNFDMMPGNYSLGVRVNSSLGRLYEKHQALKFAVTSRDSSLFERTANRGVLALKSRWTNHSQ